MFNRDKKRARRGGAPDAPALAENLPAIVGDREGVTLAVWNTLKSSVFPGATDESIVAVLDYCAARYMDPLKKPCHIVPMKVRDRETGNERTRDVIMAGIAETRITAHRTGEYLGHSAPEWGPDIDHLGATVPEWCRITVRRAVKAPGAAAQVAEFTAQVWFAEACATVRWDDGSVHLNAMWATRSRGQLEKCTEAAALRKAFPEETGGATTGEEMIGRTLDPNALEADFDVDPDPAPRLPADAPAAGVQGARSRVAAASERRERAESPRSDDPPDREGVGSDEGGARDAPSREATDPDPGESDGRGDARTYQDVAQLIGTAQSAADLDVCDALLKDATTPDGLKDVKVGSELRRRLEARRRGLQP